MRTDLGPIRINWIDNHTLELDNEYICKVKLYGWTYCKVHVYKKRKFWFNKKIDYGSCSDVFSSTMLIRRYENMDYWAATEWILNCLSNMDKFPEKKYYDLKRYNRSREWALAYQRPSKIRPYF